MKAVVPSVASKVNTLTRNHKKSAGASGSTSTMMKYILKPNDFSLAATVACMTSLTAGRRVAYRSLRIASLSLTSDH